MMGHFSSTLARVSDATRSMVAAVIRYNNHKCLYNNQINTRALIGQSAVGDCGGKPTEKSRLLNYNIKAIDHKFSMGYRLINHLGCR